MICIEWYWLVLAFIGSRLIVDVTVMTYRRLRS
jgi:hypothetical protein